MLCPAERQITWTGAPDQSWTVPTFDRCGPLVYRYDPAAAPGQHGGVLPGKEVTAMAQKTFAPRPERSVWEPPAAEEITVSAEATMYMGTWKDEDWV